MGVVTFLTAVDDSVNLLRLHAEEGGGGQGRHEGPEGVEEVDPVDLRAAQAGAAPQVQDQQVAAWKRMFREVANF